ncbi:SWIM zinc finger family protein [Levilactobacillus acidifarinae]|uniref:SWIM zinc finger family protein n=1 Tax=Levilactobacillus acidifarinae TaxID=267364 RepID=UPI001649ADCD|nr:SWIM zinc finger family protein [Levilactobacillus acidifarinae]
MSIVELPNQNLWEGLTFIDWETLFQSQILDRGYAYYLDGAVQNLQQTATQLTAQVQGTQRYQVTITLQDEEVQTMTCDCPYADGQRNCKHMAAVLFAAEEIADGDGNGASDDSITDLIAQATTQQMRDFLMLVLPHNPTLATLFRTSGSTEPVIPIRPTANLIDAICEQYTDQQGFIDYDSATPFANDLLAYLDDDLTVALQNHQDQDVFDAISHLFLVLDQLEIDDSDGEIMMLLDAGATIWTKLVHQATLSVKRQLFDWLCTQIQRPLNALEETIQDLLFGDDFTEPEFLTAKLTLVDTLIQRARQLPDTWERDWQVEQWTILRLRTMVADADIEAFCHANVAQKRVRDYYVDFCLQRQRPQEAIDLLREGKRVNRDLVGVVCHDSHRLATIYQQLGQTTNYRQELWRLLTDYDPANLDDFKAYQASFRSSEWPVQRQKLLAALKDQVAPAELTPLYAHEGLDQSLLQAIIAQKGLAGVQTYGPALKNKYARQIIQKYVTTVQQAVKTTGTRKHYRKIVGWLREMATYPNGSIQAQQLISEWQQTYPRRSAMLDELSRFRA